MITFEDYFRVNGIPTSKIKVKFNINADNKKLLAWDYLKYSDGTKEYDLWVEMNAYKTKHANHNYGDAEYVLAFAQYYPLGQNYYIFGGLYKIEKIIPEVFDCVGYKLTLMDDLKDLRRRVVIKTKVSVGQSINRLYDNVIKNLKQDDKALKPEIYEVLPPKIIDDFPGFNNVLLTHKELQYIFKNDAPEWRRQLSSVKGVYCVTDTSNGKLYIGSAYGEYAGIWQRWSEYANLKNMTGGNKVFKNYKKHNINYIPNNFTYSILEIFDTKTPDDKIIERESFWKDVFKSRKFGMNNN